MQAFARNIRAKFAKMLQSAHQNFLVAAFLLLYNIFRKNYSEVRQIMAKQTKFTVYEKLSKNSSAKLTGQGAAAGDLLNPSPR